MVFFKSIATSINIYFVYYIDPCQPIVCPQEYFHAMLTRDYWDIDELIEEAEVVQARVAKGKTVFHAVHLRDGDGTLNYSRFSAKQTTHL